MENAAEIYGFLERVRQCHQLLQDDLSRKIFEVRLALDYAPSPANVSRIVALSKQQKWMDALDESIPAIVRTARQDPKKLVLYGTNVTGRAVASRLLEKGVEFYGFCGRRAQEFPDGLMGKPVIAPEFLFQNAEDFYVIISAADSV